MPFSHKAGTQTVCSNDDFASDVGLGLVMISFLSVDIAKNLVFRLLCECRMHDVWMEHIDRSS